MTSADQLEGVLGAGGWQEIPPSLPFLPPTLFDSGHLLPAHGKCLIECLMGFISILD